MGAVGWVLMRPGALRAHRPSLLSSHRPPHARVSHFGHHGEDVRPRRHTFSGSSFAGVSGGSFLKSVILCMCLCW